MGISEVVYNQGYMVDSNTAAIFAESGVRLRQFSPPTDGLVDLSVGTDGELVGGEVEVEDVRIVLDDESFVRSVS